MEDNHVLLQYEGHPNFTDAAVRRAIEEVSEQTGFIPNGEIKRRFLYTKDKTWRVRIDGMLDGKPANLRVENMELETDEEAIRETFRKQENEVVRPPMTYGFAPFDAERGYGWSIDEAVGGVPLFSASDVPRVALQSFIPFYKELRATVRAPFWPQSNPLITGEFTEHQLRAWDELAMKRNPSKWTEHADLLSRLEMAMWKRASSPLQFMHAHLAGDDVRVIQDGAYVVFANHFWSWRQPGYDVAFTIWSQWMGLPAERRSPNGIKDVTETWLDAVRSSLPDLVKASDVRWMLLNRCYGSLILDIPAKRERHTEEEVAEWESAVVAEAERLLA